VAASDPPRQIAPRAERFQPSAQQWSPNRWTSELGPALVVALRRVLRSPEGWRPAHRYGVVWTGHFTPSGEAAGHSDFVGFRGDPFPALVRFSNLFRGHGERDIRGMATKLMLPDGEVTDLVAMSAPVFPVRRSRDFLALLEALQKGPFRSLPAIVTMVASRRLSTLALLRGIVAAARFRDDRLTTFHGVQTFRLVRCAGLATPPEQRPMRYRWVPSGPGDPGTAAGSSTSDQIRFTLQLALGHSGWERVNDPTRPWSRDTPTVCAGELVLERIIQPEPTQLGFNPAVLAPGIEPGDDELFSDRAGAYAVAQAARLPGNSS
jgi:catalase